MLEQTGEQNRPVGDGHRLLEFFDLADRKATRTERSRRVPCRLAGEEVLEAVVI
jgi:hypothetical protein